MADENLDDENLADANLADENLDDAKLVVVARRATETAAMTLVTVLRDAGIRSVATGGFTAGFRAEAPGMVEVQTLERDAERAREVLAEIRPFPDALPADRDEPRHPDANAL